MTRTRSQTAAAAIPKTTVSKAKKTPVPKAKPSSGQSKKALEQAKVAAKNKAIEQAKADAKKNLVEKAKAEAREKALEQANVEARKKAIEKAKEEAKEEARTGSAQVSATSSKSVENKDKKEANLLYLRTALATAFSNHFKGTGWSTPEKDAITNLNNKEFTVTRKLGNTEHRCQMEMDQDTASFQLTPVSNESVDGLNRSFAAYQESFNKWRTQQNLQGNKEYDLTFTLNVQSTEDLKVILKSITKECKITKFELKGVPMPAAEVELIQNEIASETQSRPKRKVK